MMIDIAIKTSGSYHVMQQVTKEKSDLFQSLESEQTEDCEFGYLSPGTQIVQDDWNGGYISVAINAIRIALLRRQYINAFLERL